MKRLALIAFAIAYCVSGYAQTNNAELLTGVELKVWKMAKISAQQRLSGDGMAYLPDDALPLKSSLTKTKTDDYRVRFLALERSWCKPPGGEWHWEYTNKPCGVQVVSITNYGDGRYQVDSVKWEGIATIPRPIPDHTAQAAAAPPEPKPKPFVPLYKQRQPEPVPPCVAR